MKQSNKIIKTLRENDSFILIKLGGDHAERTLHLVNMDVTKHMRFITLLISVLADLNERSFKALFGRTETDKKEVKK